MKKLIHTVDLIFFCDSANGQYGLTHKETHNADNGFNAFWDGVGMFHDIFEHAHEHKHKYFQGDYAMNMGGELAAMGAMWYFIDEMNINKRIFHERMRRNPGETMRETTCVDLREAISEGYCQFGYTLESCVPKQSPVYNPNLEDEMLTYWESIKKIHLDDRKKEDEFIKDFSEAYKRSITFGKIANLHRYGFRMAERMVPNNLENQCTLNDFIIFWNDFMKNNSAEELMRSYQSMKIKIYKEKGVISWKAFLTESTEDSPDYKIKSIYNVLDEMFVSND